MHSVHPGTVCTRFSSSMPAATREVALPEHSFHAREPNSNENSVPIPLLNGEKAKWACGVTTA
jgi:hypothetical protein